MKKSVLILGLVTFFLASCGETKKEEVKQKEEVLKPTSRKGKTLKLNAYTIWHH